MKRDLAAFLLFLAVLRHITWSMVSPEMGAYIWNLSGAVVIAALLCFIYSKNKTRSVLAVVLWFLYEELLVGTCSVWRILGDTWVVPLGSGLCSNRLDAKFISLSLLALGCLIIYIYYERPNNNRSD